MGYDVRVIPIREFMKTDITGELDVAETRQTLSQIMHSLQAGKHHSYLDRLPGSEQPFNHHRRLDAGTRSWVPWRDP